MTLFETLQVRNAALVESRGEWIVVDGIDHGGCFVGVPAMGPKLVAMIHSAEGLSRQIVRHLRRKTALGQENRHNR